MPVILKTLRSAGVGRRKVKPMKISVISKPNDKKDIEQNQLKEDEADVTQDNECCLFAACLKTKHENQDSNEDDLNRRSTKPKPLKQIRMKVRETKDKVSKFEAKLDAKKMAVSSKMKNIKDQQTAKVKAKIPVINKQKAASKHEMPDSTRKDENSEETDNVADKSDKSNDPVTFPQRCKTRICTCLDNRLLCFIITMTLAHLHFLIYVVELVFLFCFVC